MADHIAVAQHLLTQTYPGIKDPKLLLAIVKHIRDGIDDGITKTLEKARKNKEIPSYGTTFNGKLTTFKMHLARKLGVNPVDFMMIAELQELIIEHERSPVEFRRKNTFVIASNNYTLRTLNEQKVKTYLQRAKKFLKQIS